MRTFSTAHGDRVTVGVSGRFEQQGRTVRFDGPSGATDLAPDVARSIAVALIEHAARADRDNVRATKERAGTSS